MAIETLEEFAEEYSGAPYELHELADVALQIEEENEVTEAAQVYLDAREAFLQALEENGIEPG